MPAFVLLTLLTWAARPALRCTLIIVDIALRDPPSPLKLYHKLFAYHLSQTYVAIPGIAGPIRTRVVSPVGLEDPPVIVLVHGLVYQGIESPLIIKWSNVLAEGGFRVVVPEVASERTMLMRNSGVDDISSTTLWAAREYKRKVSVMGVSFSGGLVLKAATRPEVSREMKLVAVFSGYNSIERLSRYYLGERAAGPDNVAYPGPPPSVGPLLIALQYMDYVLKPEGREKVEAALRMYATEQDRTPEGIRLIASLTPDQRAEYDGLLHMTSPAIKAELETETRDHMQLLKDISPQGSLNQATCPVYILHGKNDIIIPNGEARWNMAGLPPSTEAHLLISPALAHVTPDQSARRLERAKVTFFLLRTLLAMSAKHGSFPLS